MIKITPAVRITIGIVALTLSLLLIADLLGIVPDGEKEAMQQRQRFAEMSALQISIAIKQRSGTALQSLLWSIVQRNDQVISAAVRRRDGVVLASYGDHLVSLEPGEGNTDTQIILPIMEGEKNYGSLELIFIPVGSQGFLGLPRAGILALLLFVLLFGSLGYWIFLRRSLTYLDPSSVVPARVRAALNVLTNGVLILDSQERIVMANGSFVEKMEISADDLLGKKPSDLPWVVPKRYGDQFVYPWNETLSTGVEHTGVTLKLEGSDQSQYTFSVNSSPIVDADGKQRGVIVGFDDVTELERKNLLLKDTVAKLESAKRRVDEQNVKLHIMATRDPLTNCHNRRSLYETLETVFQESVETGESLSCIMVDIDHFKSVNDMYGHAVGDQIIKMVASELTDTADEDSLVCRYGGEEFCIMLKGVPIFEAKKVAERCRQKIEGQVTGDVKVTASFGVSTLRYGAETVDELISQADEALYASKSNGRNRISTWEKQRPMGREAHNVRSAATSEQ